MARVCMHMVRARWQRWALKRPLCAWLEGRRMIVRPCETLTGFPIDSESRSIVSYATSSSLSTSSWYLSPSLCSYILTYIVVWWVQYVPRVILVSMRPRSHEAFNFLGFSYPFDFLIESASFTSISSWEVVWGDEWWWFFGFLSIIEHSVAYPMFCKLFQLYFYIILLNMA